MQMLEQDTSAPTTFPARVMTDVLSRVGDRVAVLNGTAHDPSQTQGREALDCAVVGLDRHWPLRLEANWRVCQWGRFEAGWHWVLERHGRVLALDALEDPEGIYLPTSPVSAGDEPIPAAVSAAFLTAKRIRKRDFHASEWRAIGQLASEDATTYLQVLSRLLGRSLAQKIGLSALRGVVPEGRLCARAQRVHRWRKFRTPHRSFKRAGLSLSRLARRLLHPSGLTVLVAGPDGSGKSTFAAALAEETQQLFPRCTRLHWRPGVLPRPGALARKEEHDYTSPHGRPPHGRILSLVLLLYYWLDFAIGSLLKILPAKTRTELVLIERGWCDVAVDPTRYRLRVPKRLVRALGGLLPKPDLAFILEAKPEIIFSRKQELPSDELQRQCDEWRLMRRCAVHRSFIDASRSRGELVAAAKEEIISLLERRAMARLGAGWFCLGKRWILPRGPRSVARQALQLYQPITRRAHIGWSLATIVASIGGFRLFPRSDAPPRAVRELIAPYIPRGCTIAASKANHPGRYTLLILGSDGRPMAVAKVSTDPEDARALQKEAQSIRDIGSGISSSLNAPRLLAEDTGVLVFASESWRPRLRPWMMPEEVAAALGQAFRPRGDVGTRQGPAHGDFAPWNLLRVDEGWVLVDWEGAQTEAPAFFDVFHYLTQSHALIGRPSKRSILKGLAGKGRVGRAIWAYADAAGVPVEEAAPCFALYLAFVSNKSAEADADSPRAVIARRAALTATIDARFRPVLRNPS